MTTHADIVRAAGQIEDVAAARGVSVHTVRSWIQRNRIPAEHWLGFVEGGATTYEVLAEAVAVRAIQSEQSQ